MNEQERQLERTRAAAQWAPAFRASQADEAGLPLVRFLPEAGPDGALRAAAAPFLKCAELRPDAGWEACAGLGAADILFVEGLGAFLKAETYPALLERLERLGLAEPGGAPARTLPGGLRLSGKVSVVTGSAQGFGEGIATEMARQGAHVVIADLNLPLAETVAARLNAEFGAGSAIACAVNVGEEESVEAMVNALTLHYGGLDILVSNAGVVRAGGLEEMDMKNFEFVTRINYTAYFICAKYASRPMKIQNKICPRGYADIIQINSKSGLEGSKRNFAYAGTKFGGIGLTQSFAKELVGERIKVNSVCPGNFYEGPLWSDPEKGLFRQYLEAGKVEGAKTIEDVYNYYIRQVPMQKGCSPLDVARAIFYLVEQENETGQALPVTGGQIMMN